MFRLAQLLPDSGNLPLAEPIRTDMAAFLQQVATDPDFDYKVLTLAPLIPEPMVILDGYYQLSTSA